MIEIVLKVVSFDFDEFVTNVLKIQWRSPSPYVEWRFSKLDSITSYDVSQNPPILITQLITNSKWSVFGYVIPLLFHFSPYLATKLKKPKWIIVLKRDNFS